MSSGKKRAAQNLSTAGRATFMFGLVLVLVGGWGLTVPAASATGTESEVSIRWGDVHPTSTSPDAPALQNLRVTVAQTQDLTSQGVRVSWTGAPPTSLGEFATNYLQIMQCWGDADTGPQPEQCQWGAVNNALTSLIGLRVGSRDLVRDEDELQKPYNDAIRIPPPPDNPFLNAFRIPFRAVDGTRTFNARDFFDANTSNEVTAVRTGSDGTGSLIFEVQTALEAPHLGCGAQTSNGPRQCWLVVVPRGTFNLNGADARTATAAGRVVGSPLSASAWAQRIVVPLEFQPLAVSCPIGQEEERVAGAETISAAVTRWQPTLCGQGVTLGFSQLGDGEARRLIAEESDTGSRLAFVTKPLSAEERGDAVISYAPVAQTALVVGYNIDYVVNSDSPLASRNGTPVSNLVLNARLVAKLLTQSYRNDTPDGGVAGGITGNPSSIVKDPEFLRLNPDFRDFAISAFPPGILVTLGGSDATSMVWEWLQTDQSAQGFLAGIPDENGMTLNTAYRALELDSTPTDSFPKADLSTLQADGAPAPGFGTLDMRPYMNDYTDAALRTLRGDTGARIVWDPSRIPPSYAAVPPQAPGARFMIAIVDAPNAARFGLRTAQLVNAAGQTVAPTRESITAMIAGSPKDEATGVRTVQPGAVRAGAYPLSIPVYAAVNVCGLDQQTRTRYETVLTYAIGDGQRTGNGAGELPVGYVPLSDDDRTASTAAISGFAKAAEACPTTEAPAPEPEVDPVFVPDFDDDVAPPVDEPETFPGVDTTRAIASGVTGIGPIGFTAALVLGAPSLLIGAVMSRRARRLLEQEEALFEPA